MIGHSFETERRGDKENSCRPVALSPCRPVALSPRRYSLSKDTSHIHAAAAALRREEWFEHAGEGREVACLDQNFTRPREFGDDAFATQHAAEPAGGRRLAQFVSHVALPGHEMACVDDVSFARIKPFAVNRTERRNEQQARPLYLQNEQPFAAEE